MKKTYQIPATEILNMSSGQLLTDSLNVYKDEEIENSGSILSREFSWGSADDEMDEDF
ncbi:MAG: hypothetical protein IKN02_07145 [Prevotella sp.]|jgi:hypothetical protein|nr:hypothetical protein [Prevotella sp.]